MGFFSRLFNGRSESVLVQSRESGPGFFSRLFNGRSESALVQSRESGPTEMRDISIVVNGDGFIPQVQFAGASLDELLEATTYLYACVSTNAKGVANLPAVVQRRGKKGEAKWVNSDPGHALEDFVDAPTGANVDEPPTWGWDRLLLLVSMHLDLAGNAYLLPIVVNGGRRLHSVRLLDPNSVTVEKDEYGHPKLYRVGSSTYKPSQIVHIVNPTPGDLAQGAPTVRAALRPAVIDRTAHERQNANLANRIAPGLIMSVKGAFGITDTQREEIAAYMRKNYQKATDDGRPLVVGEDTKVLSAPTSTAQNDYFETRKFSRDEMLAVFGTPPTMVGVYENATLQNFAQSLKIWWMVALSPRSNAIYSALNRQLVTPIYGKDVRLWYDLTGTELAIVLLKERIETADGLVELGYPANVASAHVGLGLPHFDELDVPNVRITVAGHAGDLEPTEPVAP